MGLNLNYTFKAHEDHALEKAKKAGEMKSAIEISKIKGERLFIDIHSPSLWAVICIG